MVSVIGEYSPIAARFQHLYSVDLGSIYSADDKVSSTHIKDNWLNYSLSFALKMQLLYIIYIKTFANSPTGAGYGLTDCSLHQLLFTRSLTS